MSKKKFEVGFNISAAMSSAFSGTIGKASRKISSLGETIRKAEAGQKGIKRFQDLQTGINKTKSVFVKARVKAAALKKELAKTAKPTKKLSDQMSAAHKNVNKLGTKLKTQRSALVGARFNLDQTGISTRKLVSENNRLAASFDKSRAAQKKMNKAQAAKVGARKKIGNMAGKAATARVATGNILGIPIFSSAMLNAEMSKVKALSGASDAQMEKMRNQASFLGDTKAGVTAPQVGEGQAYLSMSGFTPEETMAAMPGLLDVSKVAGEELRLTADIAKNILSGFEIPANQMGRVGDVLTQTFTSSDTTLSDLGETIKYAAPMANHLNVSFEETAAMAGLIAKIGIRGTQANNELETTMSKLAAPTEVGENALEALGVTWDDNGDARNVIGVLGDISDAMAGMGTGEQTSYLKDIFGQDNYKTGAKLMKLGKNKILKYYSEINNAHKLGKAAKTAKIMDDNEIGRLKRLTSAADGLARVFGDKLTPAINSILTVATKMVRGVTSWLNEHDKLAQVLTWGTVIIGGLTTVVFGLGAAIAAVKFAIAGLGALKSVIAIFTFFKAVLVGIAVVTAPISGTILAIAAAVVGVGAAVFMVVRYWEPIKGFFKDLWEKITKVIDKLSMFSSKMALVKNITGFLSKKISIPGIETAKEKVKGSFKKDATQDGGDPAKTKGGFFSKFSHPKINFKGFLKTANLPATNKENFNKPQELINKGAALPRARNKVEINQTVAPVINIAPGADPSSVRQAVAQGMETAGEKMRESMDNLLANERRLAYE